MACAVLRNLRHIPELPPWCLPLARPGATEPRAQPPSREALFMNSPERNRVPDRHESHGAEDLHDYEQVSASTGSKCIPSGHAGRLCLDEASV
jgi:hypothetical protein